MSAALACPRLWARIHIPAASALWTNELVLRSKRAPFSSLSMELSEAVTTRDDNTDYLSRFLCPPVTESTQSIRILRIALSTSYKLALPSARLAPSTLGGLQELCFWNFGNADTVNRTRPLIQFFASHSTQLQKLSLLQCAWDRRLFHDSLTTLELRLRAFSQEISEVYWEDLFGVLAPLNRLQSLTLRSVFDYLRHRGRDEPRTISFPQLQVS
ncbi:hypothetical protein AX16_006706 [Volvariella volvacea WC 439]|nr:hypothetical protein AX16_006706 [Volvariella volvacea WC 439]